MPWQERCAMDERMTFVSEYLTGLWTMTQLCDHFAVSRKTGYKWLRRYDSSGRSGLADQSRRPHGHPETTPVRVVQRLLETRTRFPRWSMGKIVTWLARRYPRTAWPCRTTAYALMERAGVARVPVRARPSAGRRATAGHALTEPLAPNAVWTTDFKGKFRLGNAAYCHPFTLRDGFSRFVLRCDGVPAESYPYTRPLFERAFAEFGLPDCIRSGGCNSASASSASTRAARSKTDRTSSFIACSSGPPPDRPDAPPRRNNAASMPSVASTTRSDRTTRSVAIRRRRSTRGPPGACHGPSRRRNIQGTGKCAAPMGPA